MKLSKTMQAAYDKMLSADWYYMHEGKTCEYIATEDGFRTNGYSGAGVVKGGYVYARMSSNTLNALAKRELIEIAIDGKGRLDVVKVVGMELPKQIKKALKVKLVRTDNNHPEWRPTTFTGFATSKEAVQHLITHFEGKNNSFSVAATIEEEVELSVWDILKDK